MRLINVCTSLAIPTLTALLPTVAASGQETKSAPDLTIPARTSSAEAPPKAASMTPPVPDFGGLFDVMHYQLGDDGSIYAAGKNYKAQFSDSGLTFVPYGGEPMHFSLASASVGGKPLSLEADAQPTRSGDTISIDRGAFVEQYLLKPGSVEQLFTINQLPPHGELVLKITVGASSLVATEKAESLDFVSERDAVNYSKAMLVDSNNARTNLSTKVSDGMIEIRVPSSTLNRAAFPVTIDPVISTGEVNAMSAARADVAYDATSNRFAVVLEHEASANDGDIWSFLLDTNGNVIPGTVDTVDITFDNWRKPRIANNNIANMFMVVAERGLAPNRGVWGNTIDPQTGNTGAQFQIINGGGGEKTNPDIGGDRLLAPPTYFLVVWEWAAAPGDHDIAGRLLDVNGVQQGGEIFLDLSNTDQTNPAVSKNNGGSDWMVVWQNTYSPSDEDIYGAVVHWDGQITHAASVLDFSSISNKNPQVSSPRFDGTYLTVYESNGSIAARLADDTLTTLQLTTLEALGDNPFAQPRHEPTVDCDGDKFVVGYSEEYANDPSDWDLYADTLCANGEELHMAEMHKYLDYTIGQDHQAAVATTSSGGGPMTGPAVFAWTHGIPALDTFTIWAGRYDNHISCCPADCAPAGGDGVINVSDLLMVINQWTAAPAICINCAPDVNGDLAVNTTDLLQIINAWGVCP